MSQSHYETIVCPKCQNAKKFAIWDLINVSKDPLLLPPLLSGELTTFRCRKCQTETPLDRDLLFHDSTRRLAIWLQHPGGHHPAIDAAAQALLPSLASDYTCRLVASFADLVEKIRIAIDGHTDTAMELVKFDLASRFHLAPATPLHYSATELDPTSRKTFVFRSVGEQGPIEIRSPEADSTVLLRDHLRAVQGQTASIGRHWIQVNRAHVAKALGLDDEDRPPKDKSLDAQTIEVFTLGMTPEFASPHAMDEWVASGATTFQRVLWQIGRDVSAKEAELHRDRKTGQLYVVFRRVGKEWKRHFVARKIFEELKAKEAG